jgi:hypothetical protein
MGLSPRKTHHLRKKQLTGIAGFIIGPGRRPDPVAPTILRAAAYLRIPAAEAGIDKAYRLPASGVGCGGQARRSARAAGNRLEALRGDRQGQHSIRINDQWRLCFSWREGTAWDVEVADYH